MWFTGLVFCVKFEFLSRLYASHAKLIATKKKRKKGGTKESKVLEIFPYRNDKSILRMLRANDLAAVFMKYQRNTVIKFVWILSYGPHVQKFYDEHVLFFSISVI